jgi:hypothetical protein
MRDPDGIAFGAGFLRLATDHLEALGRLWLDGGRWESEPLADPAFVAAMVGPQSAGGPPEDCAYGLLTWVAADHFFAAGWVAGRPNRDGYPRGRARGDDRSRSFIDQLGNPLPAAAQIGSVAGNRGGRRDRVHAGPERPVIPRSCNGQVVP